jgi:phosphopantothenoylcysteine decarboxylase/phosphopantothenate--cysteine ligase
VSEFERDPARGRFPDQPAPAHEPLHHLELVANADLYLIAPASANTIAKLAGGHADSLLATCALAATCPLLVAPAMNNHMYEHPATQANLRTLAERGAIVIPPGTGRLASRGEEGVGRLPEPQELLHACEAALGSGSRGRAVEHGSSAVNADRGGALAGTRVLVTAGGTREPIDSVRYVGNSSSGRMGLALAQAALARGAHVTLIAANVALPTPDGVQLNRVVTAAELARECEREFPGCDVLLMAAAVADFAPAQPASDKLKKAGREALELVLEPTADVLSGLAEQRRAGQTLVGFAAEYGHDAVFAARGKLVAKQLDALVVNDISRADIGFDAPDNEVTILSAQNGGAIEELHVPRASKAQVAEAVLDAVQRLRASE